MNRPRFVLFGDSITQHSFKPGGWGAALADVYCRKADVVLRGYSGYNTRWALNLIPSIFSSFAEALLVVTIFFGANDAALPDRGSARQHVPVGEYKKNLLSMISHIKGNQEMTRIILITPPPVSEAGRQAFARATYGNMAEELPERTNQAAGEYAMACKEVAYQCSLPVVDTWSVFQHNPNWQQLYLSDGLHLTEAGNNVIFLELLNVLGALGLGEADLQMDFPPFTEVM